MKNCDKSLKSNILTFFAMQIRQLSFDCVRSWEMWIAGKIMQSHNHINTYEGTVPDVLNFEEFCS